MWKVLLADDEPFVREGLEKLIPWEELGYQLEGAYKNGRELVEAIPGIMPDLVILDIQMPLMNGLEAAKIIHERWPDIVVILLTAYREFQYAQQAISYKVRSYVLKNNLLTDLPGVLKEMAEELEHKDNQSEGADDLIQMTQSYVEERLANKLTLEEIADAVHVNRSYLSRLYKQKTGENLFEMINRRRVDKAKEYIRHGNKKIYEIACLVGLDDTAYFSRVFKRYAGCSPKEYETSVIIKGEEV